MTDAEPDAVAATWATLDALLDDLSPDTDIETAEQRDAGVRAVAALRARGAGAVAEATPYLWEYVEDIDDRTGEHTSELPAGDPALWTHVSRLRSPGLSAGHGDERAPSPVYVSFEAEVTWEPEHGLQLVFDAEGHVARVGPYTGHITVAAKFGAAFIGEIYG